MQGLAAQRNIRFRYALTILRAMVVSDFTLRYQSSILGYLWTLLKPLAIFTILYLVFVQLLKIGADVPFTAIYLLFGIVIWSFFAEATTQGLASMVQRSDLLRKISFPRYVIVVAVTMSALITFGLSMIVIVLFMALAEVPLTVNLLWLPLLFLELLTLSLALGLVLSGLFVRYRDLSYIWEVVLQAGFYAAPIIYPLSMVPQRWARFLLLNPIAQIIQDARYALVTDQTVTITQAFGSPWVRVIPVGMVAALALFSVVYFKRRSPHFAEEAWVSSPMIAVRGVSKDFLLPHLRHTTLKSRVIHLFRGRQTIEVQTTLKDVGFEVERGEFFGVVGRNGCGKSTLLKILAGIYQPTSGTVTVHGRLVPFIELGVGFNPELTGRQNVYLNGALLGFSPAEVDAMYDDIVAFAELEGFMDQKLKNYSSGMQVRIAFSVATRAHADILLIDEVLAVGDIAFKEKCYEHFRALKAAGTTIVFVTHDMDLVREFCDRVVLIEDARLAVEGDAYYVADQYDKLFTLHQRAATRTRR